MPRLALRFSTQTLLLQLGVVLLVVLLSGTVHAWLVYGRIGAEAENQALTLARTVASDPVIRSQVQAISKEPGTPPATVLAAGPIQAAAEAARSRTGALFVVVTDEPGCDWPTRTKPGSANGSARIPRMPCPERKSPPGTPAP